MTRGLVVMGRDLCSEGYWFDYLHCVLDGNFSHIFVGKIVMFVWKDENRLKRGRVRPSFKTFSSVSITSPICKSCDNNSFNLLRSDKSKNWYTSIEIWNLKLATKCLKCEALDVKADQDLLNSNDETIFRAASRLLISEARLGKI